MVSADEPGFDIAEQSMDDREELAGIDSFALDHRRVLQMLAEAGVAAAIAGKPVGQEMGPGRNVRLEEGAEFGARRGRQHGDPGVAGEEPVLTLHGVAVFSFLVLRRRHLLHRGDNQALVRVDRAASGTCRIASAADEGLVRLEEPAQQSGGVFAQTMAQLVRHGPRRLVRHHQFPLQKFGRDAALVAAHQIGGKKPLHQIRPRPMKHRSRRHRFLPMAGAALEDPWPRLQPPSHPPATARTHKTAGPAKPGQVLNAPLLGPEPRRKLQKPAHPTPSLIDRAMLPQGEKSSLVNWLPWSVLKISGRPKRASASSSASTQKSAPSVFDSCQASTARLCQSMIATRYTNPLAIGI